MKLIVMFIIIIFTIIAFLYPEDCSKTGGAVSEGSIFKSCTCLGLILNPKNPLSYIKQCYGIPISYSCEEWVEDGLSESGKFIKIPCE